MILHHEQRCGLHGAQNTDGEHGEYGRRDPGASSLNNADTDHSHPSCSQLASTEEKKARYSDQDILNMVESLRRECDLLAHTIATRNADQKLQTSDTDGHPLQHRLQRMSSVAQEAHLAAEDAQRATQKVAASVESLQQMLAEFALDETPSSGQEESQQPQLRTTHEEESTAWSSWSNPPLVESQPSALNIITPVLSKSFPVMMGQDDPLTSSKQWTQPTSNRIHAAGQWGYDASSCDPTAYAHRQETIGHYEYPDYAPRTCDPGRPFGYLHPRHTAAAVIPEEYFAWFSPLATTPEDVKHENTAGSAASMAVEVSPAADDCFNVDGDSLFAYHGGRHLSNDAIWSNGQPLAADHEFPGGFAWP